MDNCPGNSQKLCNKEDCEKCFNKSFSSHPKAKYWSDKNTLLPREVFKSSAKKILFDCNKCNHEFSISLNKISCLTRWCSYCACKKLCKK